LKQQAANWGHGGDGTGNINEVDGGNQEAVPTTWFLEAWTINQTRSDRNMHSGDDHHGAASHIMIVISMGSGLL
jgi:hypothetical protein